MGRVLCSRFLASFRPPPQLTLHFRSAVGEAMAFCMEQASVHGAMLAHVLAPGCRQGGGERGECCFAVSFW